MSDAYLIVQKLKDYLGRGTIVARKWREVEAQEEIKTILQKLRQRERVLLSHKKKRALKISEKLLKELQAKLKKEDPTSILIEKLLLLFDADGIVEDWIDYSHFADLWLAQLLPVLDRLRNERRRRRKIITLLDIKLKDVDFSQPVLKSILEGCHLASTLDELIASCIIGLPLKSNSS